MTHTVNDLRIEKIEKRLDLIEEKIAYFDSYIKSDIKSSLQDKDLLRKIKDEINFIDGKVERKK
ncbi:MAG: hypothetical protein ACOC3X_01220 [Nanoarchaeota archaeon]